MTAQTDWVPTVGARALVAVAENAEGRPCDHLKAGDEVSLRADLDDAFTASTDDGRHGVVAARHLRPVPVAPAPDQDDEPEQWWVGGDRTVYHGGDGHMDAVAVFASPTDATLAVSRVNAHAALTARAEEAEAEVERLRVRLGSVERQRNAYSDTLTTRDRELTEARAELAAATTTDRLGLPEVRVRASRPGYLVAYVGGHEWLDVEDERTTDWVRKDAAAQLALLRARLAQEAPTTTGEEADRG